MTSAPVGASRALALIWLAASVSAQAIAPASSAENATPTNPCEAKCGATYPLHTTEAATSEWKACKRGCRFLTLGSSLLDSSSGAAAERCEHSCQSAFPWAGSADDGKGAYACNLGCGYARPLEDARRRQVATEVENFFGARRFPLMNLRLPDLFHDTNWKDSPFFSSATRPQSSSVGAIFQQMRREMKDMMKNFHSTFRTIQRQDSPIVGADDLPFTPSGGPGGGGGKLVVISSGPGYREEKTYNIGQSANGDGKGVLATMMNDMLNKLNPLDDWFGASSDGDSPVAAGDATDRIAKDVEVFQPVHVEIVRGSPFSAQRPTEKHRPETPLLSNKKDIFAPFAIEVEAKEEIGDAEDTGDRSGVDGYNYEGEFMEGPRLPASGGLRTRVSASDHRPFVVLNRDFCERRDNENMKWSDWVSCLHVRIGMPRWLTAATISLGIVFVLWLCLVIPNNAPKQKVKAMITKDSKSALSKHLEACSGVSVISVPPSSEIKQTPVDVVKQPLAGADPPPAYDDVAAPQLRVKLELTQIDGATSVAAAELLPDKKEPNESEA